MLKIYTYLKEYFQTEQSWQHKLIVCCSLFLFIILENQYNWAQKLTLHTTEKHSIWVLAIWLLVYGGVYYGVLGLGILFAKQKKVFKSSEFWAKSAIAILVLALYSTSWLHTYVREWMPPGAERFWAMRGFMLLQMNALFLLPVFYFYNKEKKKAPFLYGMGRTGFDARMYLPIILVVVLIVIATSFSPHFTNYYPICKPNIIAQLRYFPKGVAVLGYETLYALTFVATEALFRGLLVVGLTRLLGRDAILPMAALYCILHFNKPLGETISSFFGGYLLGIFALRTQNIWGGVWVHLSLAMGMELLGWCFYIF
jgi:hypothetical protein